MGKEIKITSSHNNEYSSKLILGGKEYLVMTENTGKKNIVIVTRVYHEGEIISTNRTDYGNAGEITEPDKTIDEIMKRQHYLAIKMLKAEKSLEAKTPTDYINELTSLLRRNNYSNALKLLVDAIECYPTDPFILSYYGCLTSIVEKKHEEGIAACKKALEILNQKMPFGQDFFYPSFYLNLGRAYLAADKKKEAIAALKRGLKADKENRDIIWELKKIGIRRKPTLPFLKRSHPINKYMGLLLRKATK